MTTRVMFTGKADHRFAWLGNDAEDQVDILQEISTLIDGATTSIEVSTMTFNFTPGGGAASDRVKEIAEKLAQKAAAGVAVRVVGNAGHRFQRGYLIAQRGPVQLVDQYAPALVARVSFQSAAAAVPTGFVVDSGAPYGPKGAMTYGWDGDVTTSVKAFGAVPAAFTSALLGECFAAPNTATRSWSIALDPDEYYYVRVVCGEAAYASTNVIRVQGMTVFSQPDGSNGYTFYESRDADAGAFVVSTVDGGADDLGDPVARRVQADGDGRVTIQVGKPGAGGWSSLDYVEIYRASATNPEGDDGTDAHRVQRRGIHHAKFFIFEGAQVWSGSHNITPVDPDDPEVRSEDAILTDDATIVAAFRNEFNTWWGAAAGAPAPTAARTLRFKTPVATVVSVPGVLLPGTFDWALHFSPSTTVAPGADLFDVVNDHIASASRDVLLLVEQLTESGAFGTFQGGNALISRLEAEAAAGTRVHGLLGNETYPSSLSGANIDVTVADGLHNKAALVDTLRDSETLRTGRTLCGSMNWSQGAMHTNHEQTFVIGDPAVANQYLQVAMGLFAQRGNPLERNADVVVVLDRSASMNRLLGSGHSMFAAAQAAAKAFLAVMNVSGGHRVALVPFGAAVDTAKVRRIGLFDAATAPPLGLAIDAVNTSGALGGATCYGLALQEAWEQLTSVAAPAPRRVVVFLTDGAQNRAPMAIDHYPVLAANGVEIHTTSFGDPSTDPSGSNAILYEMATASGASFAQVDADDLHLRKRFADVARDAQDLATILDPSWVLSPGETVKQSFPVDSDSGRLVVAWFWGTRARGLSKVTLRTPSGATLTRSSAGVTVRSGDGHEVWHVELDTVGRAGDVLGNWLAAAQAHHEGQERLHVDLCVYATESGHAMLQVDLTRLDADVRDLRLRAWDGRDLAKRVRVDVAHAPPGEGRFEKRLARLALDDLSNKGRAWRGVLGTRIDAAPGAHVVHIVAEGVVVVRGKDGAAREVPFRRERTLQWHVSAPVRTRPPIDLRRFRTKRVK